MLLLLSALLAPADAAPRTWAFTEANFAPCEGVGINATFGIEVRADVTPMGSNTLLRRLTVNIRSPLDGFVAAGTVVVENADSTTSSIVLEPPWYTSMGAPGVHTLSSPRASTHALGPSPEEARDILVPAGAKVFVRIHPVVRSSTGTCPLGASNDRLDL